MVLEEAEYTSWVVEPLIKKKQDIDLTAKHATPPGCAAASRRRAKAADTSSRPPTTFSTPISTSCALSLAKRPAAVTTVLR